MTKKLCKSQKNRMICGVCGGFAEYFNFDPTIVRIIFAAVALVPWFRGFGVLAYIVCAFVMPKAEFSDYQNDDDIENMKSANMDGEDSARASGSKNSKKGRKDESTESSKNGGRSDRDFNEYFKK